MKTLRYVLYAVDGAVALITLNRQRHHIHFHLIELDWKLHRRFGIKHILQRTRWRHRASQLQHCGEYSVMG